MSTDLRMTSSEELDNHPTGLHPFNASTGDSITDQFFMGGDSEY